MDVCLNSNELKKFRWLFFNGYFYYYVCIDLVLSGIQAEHILNSY